LASNALTGKRWDIRLVSYSEKDADCLCISCISVAVMEKCCDACGDGEYLFPCGVLALQGDGVSVASTGVNREVDGTYVG
jgi:hypothetical protein